MVSARFRTNTECRLKIKRQINSSRPMVEGLFLSGARPEALLELLQDLIGGIGLGATGWGQLEHLLQSLLGHGRLLQL